MSDTEYIDRVRRGLERRDKDTCLELCRRLEAAQARSGQAQDDKKARSKKDGSGN